MQYINRTVTAHAFTSTSSAYVVENTDTVKVHSASIGDKIPRREIAPTNNKNNKDISIFFVTQHQLSIVVKHKQKKALLRNAKYIFKNIHFFTTVDPKRIIKMS